MDLLPRTRTRPMPSLVSGDFIITTTTSLDKDLLHQINWEKTVFVVDTPPTGFITRIIQEFQQIYPQAHLSHLVAPSPTSPDTSEQKTDQNLNQNSNQNQNQKINTIPNPLHSIILTYQDWNFWQSKLPIYSHYVFININRTAAKEKILQTMTHLSHSNSTHSNSTQSKPVFFFYSNVYKLESISKLQQLSFNRILPKKEGFGLARSLRAFGRTAEVIFAGQPHLKPNAFLVALDRDITVPCLVVANSATSLDTAAATIQRLPLLANKTTTSLPEFVAKRAWILLLTYEDLPGLINGPFFDDLRSLVQSLVAFDCTDKIRTVLNMHQLSTHVFSLCTTQDRTRAKYMTHSLPDFGINLEPTAQHLHDELDQ
ncbi:hypothetical protein NEHOM01_1501 [Nematocida homosporus]|uniref:uncharacterized protein n=1 Tax=Nematocida homosporus TaxID=1912981 RepID=UPI00221E4491|nr:uncharacterized protein NEHOM01_1501 [Nematocida homosporus]KAI5186489.1 hypothetical protein NEHOM01_1501 [Nematocida homosporus]